MNDVNFWFLEMSLTDFIPLGLAGLFIVLGRFISYYPYLFIGAVIFPRWLRKREDN